MTTRRWTTRLATDEDLRKYFGSGNLLIGSRVKPTTSDSTESDSTEDRTFPATDADGEHDKTASER